MIEAIILDLGNVVLDIGFERTVRAFETLGVEGFSQYVTSAKQHKLFLDLELGLISADSFFEDFRQLTKTTLSDTQIRNAWNLILTDFDPARMDKLTKWAQTHPLYLFSNTNRIHAEYFEPRCLTQTGQPLSAYFKQIFYSHELHQRKPSAEAFREVLRQIRQPADRTLFIDDNADNIAGAASVGLQTLHLTKPTTLLDLDF
jgi:putative hydrolase of the HAD superfamily